MAGRQEWAIGVEGAWPDGSGKVVAFKQVIVVAGSSMFTAIPAALGAVKAEAQKNGLEEDEVMIKKIVKMGVPLRRRDLIDQAAFQ